MNNACIVICLLATPALAAMSFAAFADETTGQLKGADTESHRVLIRTIDDGEILWAGTYQLGTTATVEPGTRKVNVMCEFIHYWGKEMLPGEVTIKVEAGKTYALERTNDGKQCDVSVKVAK